MVIEKLKTGIIGILMMSFFSVNAQQMFVGTYTKKEGHVDGKGEGIYVVDVNDNTGQLSNARVVAKMTNPSFIKFSAEGENLYAVSELGGGDAESGFIHSFAVEGNDLKELGKISTEAFAPCHIETDKTGNYIFVSNYVGGVVMLYKRNTAGKLEKAQKIVLENPENSHPHSVSISEDNKTAYIADLGNDRIWVFQFDSEEGKLVPHSQKYITLEEGAGPRHFTFSADEKFAYSINELNSSISIFSIAEDGALKQLKNVITLPDDFSEKNSTADIHLHPSGEFLYASNRGHNSIVAFQLENSGADLKLIDHYSTEGATPRNFVISEDGKFLYAANQDSGNIVSFQIEESGALKKLSEIKVPSPVSLEFKP